MKKDIIFHPVEGVQLAVTKKVNEFGTAEWNVIAINRNSEAISTVFVTSKGYGNSESGTDTMQKTSTLRHFFQEIPAGGYVTVEPMLPELFHLYNEYWISYFIGNQIYDKKFIFVPDSIIEDNIIEITPLGLQGVLHD